MVDYQKEHTKYYSYASYSITAVKHHYAYRPEMEHRSTKKTQQHSGMRLFSTLLVLCCECRESSLETTAPMHTASEPEQNSTQLGDKHHSSFSINLNDSILFNHLIFFWKVKCTTDVHRSRCNST